MLVFLSSAATPRYRHDILRCIAAPLGATVQFRYAKRHCTESALEKLSTLAKLHRGKGRRDALVCFADVSVDAGALPLVPVRTANVVAIRTHGTTVSVTLALRDFVDMESAEFTSAMTESGVTELPTVSEGKVSGSFCFEVEGEKALSKARVGAELSLWEILVGRLQQTTAYAHEAFFWTVLGIVDIGVANSGEESFKEWPEELRADKFQALQIYHYQPKQGECPTGAIAIETAGPVEASSPAKVIIDSRYDLKLWTFATSEGNRKRQPGWLRICVNDEWSLDLPACVGAARLRFALSVFIAGLFIAFPTISTYVTTNLDDLSFSWGGKPHFGLIATTLLSLTGGWLAAAVVLLNLPRVRP
jgi:hypothetical protein